MPFKAMCTVHCKKKGVDSLEPKTERNKLNINEICHFCQNMNEICCFFSLFICNFTRFF